MTDLEKAMLEFDEIINRPSHYNTGEIAVWERPDFATEVQVGGESFLDMRTMEDLLRKIGAADESEGRRMSHTPEKWYVGYDQEYDIDAGDDGRTIGYPTGRDEFDGTVFMVTDEDQVEIIAEHIRDEKTAHQIKAIPDMLETLGIVLSLMDESSGVVGYHLNGEVATWEELGIRKEVEAAIKKARGEE